MIWVKLHLLILTTLVLGPSEGTDRTQHRKKKPGSKSTTGLPMGEIHLQTVAIEEDYPVIPKWHKYTVALITVDLRSNLRISGPVNENYTFNNLDFSGTTRLICGVDLYESHPMSDARRNSTLPRHLVPLVHAHRYTATAIAAYSAKRAGLLSTGHAPNLVEMLLVIRSQEPQIGHLAPMRRQVRSL